MNMTALSGVYGDAAEQMNAYVTGEPLPPPKGTRYVTPVPVPFQFKMQLMLPTPVRLVFPAVPPTRVMVYPDVSAFTPSSWAVLVHRRRWAAPARTPARRRSPHRRTRLTSTTRRTRATSLQRVDEPGPGLGAAAGAGGPSAGQWRSA